MPPLHAALATAILLAPATAQAECPELGPGDFEVQARRVEAAELEREGFAPRLSLPGQRRSEGRNLLAEMERLVSLRFSFTDAAGRHLRCFGDLVAVAQTLEAEPRTAWLDDLPHRAPKLAADWGAGLRELLLDEHFRLDWNPKRGHPRDGVIEAAAWDLAAEGPPWEALRGDTRAQQVATLIRADLAAIKSAENDFRAYGSDVGIRYESVTPIRAGYVRGRGSDGAPFAGVRHAFRGKLPLWYGGFAGRARSLTHIDARGRLVCDFEAESDDFHWLAGRDVYLAVDSTPGELQAWLVVRTQGFDLAEAPEDDLGRLAVVRASLGNLKRRAEARSASRTLQGAVTLPAFRVIGSK